MSTRFLHAVIAVLCTSLLILPAGAPATPKMAEAKKSAGKAAGEEDKKKKKEEKTFKDAVEGFKIIEGLFTLYQKEGEGKVLLEIKPDQFDTIFLCSITREAADGYYFDSAAMLDAFPFVFKRVGKKIQFIHKNVYFRTDNDAAAKAAVNRGVSDSVLGAATIVSEPHPERKSLLVDPSGSIKPLAKPRAIQFLFQCLRRMPVRNLITLCSVSKSPLTLASNTALASSSE